MRTCFSRSVCVRTTMSLATGVVHDAGMPLRPSTSTRQMRQEPKLSSMSDAHSLGTAMPASMAARMIEVPSATCTFFPSIVTVTSTLLSGFLVP